MLHLLFNEGSRKWKTKSCMQICRQLFLLKENLISDGQQWSWQLLACVHWSQNNQVQVYCLFLSVLSLKIQLSRGEGWNPFNLFNPTTSLCLSQDRAWISNVISLFMFNDCSFCWYWWHCWPSLIKFSFNKNDTR
jgi:hypothetical protein